LTVLLQQHLLKSKPVQELQVQLRLDRTVFMDIVNPIQFLFRSFSTMAPVCATNVRSEPYGLRGK